MEAHNRRTFGSSRTHHRRSSTFPFHRDLDRELGPTVLDACRSLWNEFTDLAAVAPHSFGNDEEDLLRWYAEVQYLLGSRGGHCSQCRAHVRQVLPMRVEFADESREFDCLCTRCLVGFEHEADRMWYTVAGRFIEHPIRCGRARQKAA